MNRIKTVASIIAMLTVCTAHAEILINQASTSSTLLFAAEPSAAGQRQTAASDTQQTQPAAAPIPVITNPPAKRTKAKPVVRNKRQTNARIIHNELSNEIHAMNLTIAAYNREKQAGNYTTAKKLLDAILDRKQNIQALRREQKYYQ